MNHTLKSLTFVVAIFCFHSYIIAESNPHKFIDSQAQEMVSIIRNNQALFAKDPELFKDKINTVFEPMVDFRRVGASVMGKKYYLAASKSQRLQFIQSFKESLLDTYSSTLAQWGDQKIVTIFPLHFNITLHALSKFKLILFANLLSAKASCLITFFPTDILLTFFIYLSHIN